ncbi:hypothetical protein AB4305_22855 [Nocardia sp. 2YAB30]|uniref:hypothetical protein n=1 Tax=unclassified Nocardia TaxID=2637762 RepID=UPI003F9BE8C5
MNQPIGCVAVSGVAEVDREDVFRSVVVAGVERLHTWLGLLNETKDGAVAAEASRYASSVTFTTNEQQFLAEAGIGRLATV